MNYEKAKERVLKSADKAPQLSLGKNDFYVWLPDFHLGAWDSADDARKNAVLILNAVKWYVEAAAQFIVGGDFWDLIEVRKAKKIYSQIHWWRVIILVLNNLAMYIAGNHDPIRKMKKHLRKFRIPEWKVHEAVWIGPKILAFHGHYFDFWNKGGVLTTIVVFIIKWFWTALQKLGATHEPKFSPLDDNTRCDDIKEQEIQLSKDEDVVVLTGHRHRPELTLLGGNAVFVDGGSFTKDNGGTVVEISKEKMQLVFWDRRTGERRVLKTYWLEPQISLCGGTLSVGP